ncbi:hypothetical protein PMAYCL1PPCAC_19003 [Pristionchus mayeri]|uniref:Uncharacterized protein n=1 Tax=Pristionchus mayeri TaxID=1317129 RepID=A0AAN4Z2E6_9BILA|nr:hypothetical protein PMAYCL1PPCAC_00312 [Pristionchus mayeri]GMR45057.1 hypothetical protein PMAYCL1PPCAC_15252 [Pristionchus mayeri]GMR48808.1 hypothetical protein PMAYCL1PPCAC_19003 [Pristionchus mayeri]
MDAHVDALVDSYVGFQEERWKAIESGADTSAYDRTAELLVRETIRAVSKQLDNGYRRKIVSAYLRSSAMLRRRGRRRSRTCRMSCTNQMRTSLSRI